MNYYFADPHFGHANIIRMNNRPFSSIDEMDETMINNWNNQVEDNSDIYIVGDFAYKSGKDPCYYLKELKGRKHLIIGNHDGHILKNPATKKFFVEIKDMITIFEGKQMIVLCHYPMIEWNGYFRDSIQLYGHIHNNTQNDTYSIMKNRKNAYNVGADILGYTPRTLEEAILMNKDFFKNN